MSFIFQATCQDFLWDLEFCGICAESTLKLSFLVCGNECRANILVIGEDLKLKNDAQFSFTVFVQLILGPIQLPCCLAFYILRICMAALVWCCVPKIETCDVVSHRIENYYFLNNRFALILFARWFYSQTVVLDFVVMYVQKDFHKCLFMFLDEFIFC